MAIQARHFGGCFKFILHGADHLFVDGDDDEDMTGTTASRLLLLSKLVQIVSPGCVFCSLLDCKYE